VDYQTANAAARDRILALVTDLSDEQLMAPVGEEWTIAAALAHLAFWDRVHIGRLRRALDEGLTAPPPLPDGLADIINNGEVFGWRRIPVRDTVDLFAASSGDADAFVNTLDAAVVEAAHGAGAGRLIERFRHRTEHGDAIQEAVEAYRAG